MKRQGAGGRGPGAGGREQGEGGNDHFFVPWVDLPAAVLVKLLSLWLKARYH